MAAGKSVFITGDGFSPHNFSKNEDKRKIGEYLGRWAIWLGRRGGTWGVVPPGESEELTATRTSNTSTLFS
jgi:hypothetical protein